jgi:hypothetical protein
MKKNTMRKPTKARASSPKIRYETSGRNLTSQAGLIPVIKFLDTLGFGGLFDRHVHHERQPNAYYQLVDGAFLVLIGLMGGARSIRQCVALWSDGVLQRVAGWVRIPDESTVGRLFKGVRERHVNELEGLVHALRQRVWQRALRAGTSRIAVLCRKWVDVDSTVKTVYGRQQGSAKGYNPHKRGAPSYHPLLAFCADTKEILQAWFRTGNAYTGNGIVEFTKQLLAQLPARHRIVLRADSGFFCGALMDLLELGAHGYLIKVKLKGLTQLLACQHWTPVHRQPGWEQCTFAYRADGWTHERLFLGVRCRKETPADAPQGELLALEHYDYFCYVTTEPLSPWLAHRAYGERATSETWIEEAKNQMGLAHLKTDCFLANAALFQCAVLAYNTLRWMALTSANATLKRWEPQTVRTFLVRVAGKLLTGANQLRLKLPEEHLHPKVWQDWLALGQST